MSRLLLNGKNTFRIIVGHVFFERKFLLHTTLTNFTQRKRKPYHANDILALSLVSVIIYIKSFILY